MKVDNFLKNNKFNPSKKMGQNFLSDPLVVDEIFNQLPNLDEYDCILEIGPGLGAITSRLVITNKPLICVELDKRLFSFLQTKFNKEKSLTLINDDFLEIDLNSILSHYKNVIVIANIPYSITTPIVVKCLSTTTIKTLYIMVQKDVAIKWSYDKPSNRNASTNILNYYFDINKLFDIKNTSFTPPPKVDSSIVLLHKKTNQIYNPKFYKFIKQFFLSKRKKLLNNLPQNLNKINFVKSLQKLGYDLNVRAEVLHYNDWKKLFDEYGESNNEN